MHNDRHLTAPALARPSESAAIQHAERTVRQKRWNVVAALGAINALVLASVALPWPRAVAYTICALACLGIIASHRPLADCVGATNGRWLGWGAGIVEAVLLVVQGQLSDWCPVFWLVPPVVASVREDDFERPAPLALPVALLVAVGLAGVANGSSVPLASGATVLTVAVLVSVRARVGLLRSAMAALAERKATVRESLERYRSLVETARVVLLELDPNTGRVVYMAPQAAKLFGCAESDLLRRGFLRQMLEPGDVDRASAAIRSFAGEVGRRETHTLDLRLKTIDGRLIDVRLILDPTSGPWVRGVLLDMTRQRRLERELLQSQKLESVGRLAAGVAHEINTPIQFVNDSVTFSREAVADILKVVQLLQVVEQSIVDGKPSREAAMEAIEAIRAADTEYLVGALPKALDLALDGLKRVAGIVRSMKEFAHPDGKEMAAADLNRAISSTLTIARNEYKYVADVVTELSDLPPVICHVGEVNQVVLNIVVNAAHAIGEVNRGTDRRGVITVRTRQEGSNAAIEVQDTGGGVPESIRDKIFEPFFTTKAVGQGTGQGLAVGRSVIVEKHHGQLTFESKEGVGTTFCIRLPIDGPQTIEQNSSERRPSSFTASEGEGSGVEGTPDPTKASAA